MSFADDVQGVALRLVDLLEEEGTPYAVMGGLAVVVFGIPRVTYDIDVTLSVDEAGLERFLARVADRGFDVEEHFARGFRDQLAGMEKIRIEHWTDHPRRVEVDVFLVTSEYQRHAFSRRVRARIEDRQMWVLTAADLILHKLVAGRPKDLADIQNLLAVQGVPDEDYLRGWARRLSVDDVLDTALEQAGLGPGDDP